MYHPNLCIEMHKITKDSSQHLLANNNISVEHILIRAFDLSQTDLSTPQNINLTADQFNVVKHKVDCLIRECIEEFIHTHEANTIHEEIQCKGYALHSNRITDERFLSFVVPSNLDILNEGRKQQITKITSSQPRWAKEFSDISLDHVIRCNKGVSNGKGASCTRQANIHMYYAPHKLKLGEKYLVITGIGDAYHCDYQKEGFYCGENLVIKNNDNSSENYEDIFPYPIRANLDLRLQDQYWKGMGIIDTWYCIIPDPTIVR